MAKPMTSDTTIAMEKAAGNPASVMMTSDQMVSACIMPHSMSATTCGAGMMLDGSIEAAEIPERDQRKGGRTLDEWIAGVDFNPSAELEASGVGTVGRNGRCQLNSGHRDRPRYLRDGSVCCAASANCKDRASANAENLGNDGVARRLSFHAHPIIECLANGQFTGPASA